MGMQEKGLFALDLHSRCVCRGAGIKQPVDEVRGHVIWDWSTSKEPLKPREHNAIAHRKYVRWDTKATAEPGKA